MSKTPLLLLPGLLCDGALWEPQAHQLGDVADIRVADLTRDETMTAMAMRALDSAPGEFALAGLSMGGYVALEIMRQARDRVTRLALLDTSARADHPDQTRRRLDLMDLSRRGRFKGVTPRLLPLLIHPARMGDAALTGTVTAMAEGVGMDAFLRQQTAIMNRDDSLPLLPSIACPTLVLCGREDALTPLDLHREMAALIPGARLVVVEGCGHLSTLERPDVVNAAMREWLSDN